MTGDEQKPQEDTGANWQPPEPIDSAEPRPHPKGGEANEQAHPSPVNLWHYGERGIQALNLHLNGDQVIAAPITESDPDFKASLDGRFVPPRNADRWTAASKHLDEFGIVVLCASPGTGRRTAAIRLLHSVTNTQLSILDLEPEWSRLSVHPLPKESAAGYILDLSDIPDLPEQPAERTGADLARHGEELRKKGSFLVILATPDDWYGHWAEPTLPFTVRLESPNAKPLLSAELRAHHRGDRVAWLDRTQFDRIWLANPSARATWRLANSLIQASGAEEIETIIEEFSDWHTEVERLLSKDRARESDPQLLSTRVMVWAGALLHGGQRSSVIKAADDLLTRLGLTRDAANVLTDATTSSRLTAAEITSDGDRAFHDRRKDGLPGAILRHLWNEFPTQHDLLRSWAIGIAADRTIPEEDARLIPGVLLPLAVHRHDRAILDGLASDLSGTRRWVAVEALTEAASDAEFGRYVRDRLRTWMDAKNPPDNKIELVTEICGGSWGLQQPALALRRLGKAAGHARFGSTTLINAFCSLAMHRPAQVRNAVDQWLSDFQDGDKSLRRQTLGAFLALVSSDEGTDLILDDRSGEARVRITKAWQELLSTDEAVEAVVSQLTRWQERFEHDPDRREAVLDVLADIFTPPTLRPGLDRLMVTEQSAIHPFWREVLERAARRYGAPGEDSTP